MSKPKYEAAPQVLNLTPEQEQAVRTALANYKGQSTRLEAALGALVLGQHFGWKVLRIVHSPSTYKAYEELLGVSFQETCPEVGPLGRKSVGYRFAETVAAFWDVVMGRKKVPNDEKGQISE